MEINLSNEELWDAFGKLKADNYQLRRQLKSKSTLINAKDKYIKKLEKKLKDLQKPRQHYKNGKRDNYKHF